LPAAVEVRLKVTVGIEIAVLIPITVTAAVQLLYTDTHAQMAMPDQTEVKSLCTPL
jgi:hypothetical protein